MRSDDCWYTDALIHSLGLIDRLESSVRLNLGRTYDHTRDTERFAETSSLTSDLDERGGCGGRDLRGGSVAGSARTRVGISTRAAMSAPTAKCAAPAAAPAAAGSDTRTLCAGATWTAPKA